MTKQFELHPAVDIELQEAYIWYEQKQIGLGKRFLDEVDFFNQILHEPLRYPKVAEDIREGLLNRFPYEVYFKDYVRKIRVLSIFHTARDPSIWRERL